MRLVYLCCVNQPLYLWPYHHKSTERKPHVTKARKTGVSSEKITTFAFSCNDKTAFMDHRSTTNEGLSNRCIPSLCFIKDVVRNPNIVIGDFAIVCDVKFDSNENRD